MEQMNWKDVGEISEGRFKSHEWNGEKGSEKRWVEVPDIASYEDSKNVSPFGATQRKTEYALGRRLHMGVSFIPAYFHWWAFPVCLHHEFFPWLIFGFFIMNFNNSCLKTNNEMAIWSCRYQVSQTPARLAEASKSYGIPWGFVWVVSSVVWAHLCPSPLEGKRAVIWAVITNLTQIPQYIGRELTKELLWSCE